MSWAKHTQMGQPPVEHDMWEVCIYALARGINCAPRLIVATWVVIVVSCLYPMTLMFENAQNLYAPAAGFPSEAARNALNTVFGTVPLERDIIFVQTKVDMIANNLLDQLTSDVQHHLDHAGLKLHVDVMGYSTVKAKGLGGLADQFITKDHLSSMLLLTRAGPPIDKFVGQAELTMVEVLRDRYRHKAGSLKFLGVAGLAAFTMEGQKTVARDMEHIQPVVVPLSFTVLATVLQSWRLMCIPLICILVSTITTFALMGMLSEMGMIVSTLAPSITETILVAVSFDYSLFLLMRFREEIEGTNASVFHAVSETLCHSGRVVMGSGLTLSYCATMLVLLPSPELKSIAIGSMLAVVVAIAVNLTLTPALLLSFPHFFAGSGADNTGHRHELMYDEERSRMETMRSTGHFGSGGSVAPTSRDQPHIELHAVAYDPLCGFQDGNSRRMELSHDVGERMIHRDEMLNMDGGEHENTSSFWRSWAVLSTSPACSGIVVIVLIIAFALSWAQLQRISPVSNIFLSGSRGSMVLDTLSRLGEGFSEGFVGPTTLVFVPKLPADLDLKDSFYFMGWDKAGEVLGQVDAQLMQACGGSIISAMYLRTEGMFGRKIPQQMAMAADPQNPDFQKGSTNDTLMRELNYLVDMSLNIRRTAATAILTPNIPTSSAHMATWTRSLRALLDTVNNDPNSFIKVMVSSQTAEMMDIRQSIYNHLTSLVVATLAGCMVIVALLFGSVVIAIRSVISIAFTLAVVYATTGGVYQDGWLTNAFGITGPLGGSGGVFYMGPVGTLTVVVGLALDYDIFLIGRIEELRSKGVPMKIAIQDGLAQTGHVITCAGIIMAIAFGGLLLSEVPSLNQIAFIFASAVLLDTFFVRTIVTPALMAPLGDMNWWPRTFPDRQQQLAHEMELHMMSEIRPPAKRNLYACCSGQQQ